MVHMQIANKSKYWELIVEGAREADCATHNIGSYVALSHCLLYVKLNFQ